MDFLIKLFINAGVIFGLANLLPAIRVKNFWSSVWVFLLIGLLNATVGFFLRLPLNILTLFLLCFLVRWVVSALMIKLASKLYSSFEVKTWSAAFLLALCLAVSSALLDKFL